MKNKILLLLLVLLFGCGDKSTSSNAPAISIPAAQVVAEQEIAKINQALNSQEQYQLEADELELLQQEQLVDQEELAELKKLIK